MNDRELLELAAKSVGAEYFSGGENWDNPQPQEEREFYMLDGEFWYPLEDDGDALRLAVKLRIGILQCQEGVDAVMLGGRRIEGWGGNREEATRRAIVRAAAEIGRAMP